MIVAACRRKHQRASRFAAYIYCIDIYIYICIHRYIHISMYVYIHTYIHAYIDIVAACSQKHQRSSRFAARRLALF
jgi:hypothetical protein